MGKLRNFATSVAGLTAGTTTTLTTTATVNYCINGKAYAKTAITNGATPTTDVLTGLGFRPVPANKASVFLVCLDAAGALKVAQGEVVDLSPAGDFLAVPEFPMLPDSVTAFGYLVVKAGATYVATTTGWLFGTHNNSSVTGMTYAFQDIMTLPHRPQTA